MKITQIETLLAEQLAVVRVRTDDGAEGIGQTAPFQAPITVETLHRMVAPVFLGQSPWDVTMLVDECLRRNYKFTGTFQYRALCGVETAIWDLLGQVTGQPVYNLIGGKVRDQYPVYASSMDRDISPEDEAIRVADAASQYGFRAAKVRVANAMGRDVDAAPGRSERLIMVMREALGDDFDLMADANSGFSAHRAIQIGRLMEVYDCYFFEEPCNFLDLDSTAQVSAALDIPVAGGEQDNSLHQFARMIDERVVDIVQPDIGYIGGVGRAKQVADMAHRAGMPCTLHCANQSMLQVFTAHVVASSPACYQYQEYRLGEHFPWAQEIYEPALEVVDGMITVPDRPGWGIHLLPEFIQRAQSRVSAL
ncbi:MAG: mandelate racemase/muconate lactonizing enzyme family protein [Anaerolineae bacterium]|nr:mandelate racemase/muconate lactonizing enzyme family protein [Anaerolineae bacterium]